MGLFSKKKDVCPICGQEMSMFQQTAVEKGTAFICDACAGKLRGQFNVQGTLAYRSLHNADVHFQVEDYIRALTLEHIREMLDEREAAQAQAADAYGDTFENLFKVEEVFQIAPKPMEVGIPRAKAYKNRLVARGMVVKGTFSQKDAVVVQGECAQTQTLILELIPCDGIDFNTNLRANMHKKTISEGNAWLILDLTSGVSAGSVIGR